MDCPNCKLINPPDATKCDCGYDFATASVAKEAENSAPNLFVRRRARAWRLVLGGFVVLIGLFNGSKTPKATELYGALGDLIGLLTLAVLGAWLISSGLPKTIGLNVTQRRIRRRIWYGLAAIGLLSMIVVCVLLAYVGLVVAAVLVTWLYWFGWTWISWLMADKKAVRRFIRSQ